MFEVTRGARGEVVVRLGGTFDGAAAGRVCTRLRELPAQAEVMLDFSRVREVQDLGLAALAAAIAGRTPPVALRGLGRHHERLLRYFGVDPANAARPSEARPAQAHR